MNKKIKRVLIYIARLLLVIFPFGLPLLIAIILRLVVPNFNGDAGIAFFIMVFGFTIGFFILLRLTDYLDDLEIKYNL